MKKFINWSENFVAAQRQLRFDATPAFSLSLSLSYTLSLFLTNTQTYFRSYSPSLFHLLPHPLSIFV